MYLVLFFSLKVVVSIIFLNSFFFRVFLRIKFFRGNFYFGFFYVGVEGRERREEERKIVRVRG